ncbi:MAG TPA: peptide chain release factor-like protein [Chthoniobacterales bacterium]
MSKTLAFPVTAAKQADLFRRMTALGISEADLVESFFKTVRSGGKAGLIGVNLFHPASGIRVHCRRERSQGINRFLARRMIVEKIEAKVRQKAAAEIKPAAPPQEIPLPPPPPQWGLGQDKES